jgi:SAM-dependent methyltransferase
MPEHDPYSEYYDLLYSPDQPDDAFYVEMARHTGGPVCELACGTGRIVLPLARAGFDVTGIDMSQAMLDRLQAKLDREPREVQSCVALKCADMRDYRFSSPFKLVFCAFNSFQHLLTTDDQLACLASVREYLADDGQLVLNVFAPDQSRLTGQVETVTHTAKDLETGRGLLVTNVTEQDLVDQTLHATQFVDRTAGDGSVQRMSATFTLTWIHHREMRLLLRCAGFEVVDVYGGWDRRPYDYVSGIQVFVARKA